MAHDPNCHKLAQYFLQNKPGSDESDVSALADVIQAAIEEWIGEAGLED